MPPITAICLIRLSPGAERFLEKQPSAPACERRGDALLVRTSLDFGDEPEALSSATRALLGDALLDQHAEPRGLFFLPDVAAPRAQSYDDIVEEIGEGGVWAPSRVAPPAAANMDGLAAVLEGMLGQIPSDMFAAAAATVRDNPDALAQAGAQLKGMLRDPGALDAQMPGLSEMLRGSGLDLNSPALQQMAANLQDELARDPQRLAHLAEQLFNEARTDGEDEDDDD